MARVRRLAGTRRVGHAGTLDPMATGVLVVGVNRATRLLGHLTLTEKAYDATVRLGVSTVTDDAEGEVVASVPADAVSDDAVRAGVTALTGEIEQVPSTVSAVKVGGRRAYQRVRSGEEVALAPRRVTVSEFAVLDVRRSPGVVDLDVRVVCSSGTYIRALARDLGARLGVGGHLTALRRTRVGPYDLSAARTLEQLGDRFEVVPIATAVRAAFPAREVSVEEAGRLAHGIPLSAGGAPGPVAVFAPDGTFVALVEDSGAVAKPLAVFVGE